METRNKRKKNYLSKYIYIYHNLVRNKKYIAKVSVEYMVITTVSEMVSQSMY